MPTHFTDPSNGRTLLLRGVNLADGKLPKDQPSHLLSCIDTSPTSSTTTTTTTYLDTPFSLATAPTHLARLRQLGFTVLRLPVVWDALEHDGPGRYDEAYLASLREFVALCVRGFGFRVLVNPHQDLWSRFVGGSGAPLWTLHACGLDPDGFAATHAAVRYAEWPVGGDTTVAGGLGCPGAKKGGKEGEEKDLPVDPKGIPPMMWTSNHTRLAALTVFALFWAGQDFAPRCVLDGVNIQEYLQSHYLRAYARLAEVLSGGDGDGDKGGEPLAWGWDSMNEPEPGFVGWQDLASNQERATSSAMMGSAPSPIQAMRLGMGWDQARVDSYTLAKTGPRKEGTLHVKPGTSSSCWLQEEDPRWPWRRSETWPLGTCVWALHGVWDVETGALNKADYFARRPSSSTSSTTAEEKVDWKATYWTDFFHKWVATIRQHCPQAITFIQPPVFEPPPANLLASLATPDTHNRMAYSPHYYDALTIMKRHWHKHWNVDILALLRGRQDMRTKIKALRLGGRHVNRVISDQLGTLATDVLARDQPKEEEEEEQEEEEEKEVAVTLPTLIGETGIPFDLDQGKAYQTGDYTSHVAALDAILSGCDDHLLNYTLWDYSATNTHEWGDHWNGEDLSIYCEETGNHNNRRSGVGQYLVGCRAAAAWCRPYVQSLRHGSTPVRMSFDLKTSRFELDMDVVGVGEEEEEEEEEEEGGDAVVYVPWLHYRKGDETAELALEVEAPPGTRWTLDTDTSLLRWQVETAGRWRLVLERAGGALSPRELGTVM